MLVILVLSVFVLLIGFLLFMPILICIDTDKALYYIKLKGLVTIGIEADKAEILQIKVHVFFKDFYFYPLRQKKHDKKKPQKMGPKQKKSPGLTKVLRVVQSFKVTRFYVDMDTGDCLMNAKLYPLFALLKYKYGAFNINFDGRVKLLVHIENKPIRILRSFINY
jgi:hypothetical protein